jgi:hypothetical protein
LKAERGTEHVLTDAILQVGIGADALEEGLERAEATTPSAATEARVARGSLDCDRRIALALQRQEIRRSAAGMTSLPVHNWKEHVSLKEKCFKSSSYALSMPCRTTV